MKGSCRSIVAALPLCALLALLLCSVGLPCVAAARKADTVELPTLEAILGQEYQVSIMTAHHGTFNATLRVKGSMAFPDRLHGELIPHGDPVLQPGQTALDCFSRERDFTDDKHAPAMAAVLVDTLAKDKKAAAKAKEAAAALMGVERPTLLAFDVKLHHSNSPRGSISVYVLPADLEGMIEAREAIQEGSAAPTFTANFLFRPERASMAGSPITDVPALARIASAVLTGPSSPKAAARQTTGEGDDDNEETTVSARKAATTSASAEGDFTLRLLSDHEFSLELHVPTEATDGAASPRLERVWVYGYTEPNAAVFTRRNTERAWWHMPLMIAIGSLTSLVQVLTGVNDGQKKAAERRALEEAAAAAQSQQQLQDKKDK